MLNDLRVALRSVIRQPGFFAVAVLTLALGIGATTAIFSVVDHLVLRPMPYPNGDRMAYLWMKPPASMGDFLITPSLTLARALEKQLPSLEIFDFYENESRVTDGADGAEPIEVVHARPSLFPMLGGRAQLGRTLGEEDLEPGAPRVAVISYATWRTRFGGSSDVLRQDIRLDGELYRIVGVMPRGFSTPRGHEDVWAPLATDPRQPDNARRVTVLAVLRENVDVSTATSELKRLAPRFAGDDILVGRGFEPVIVEPKTFFSATLRRSSLILFGAVGLLLLIGCANVAALLLTRNSARGRELAIRRALGASRARLVRLLLLEALIVAVGAFAAGSLLAMWTLEAFVALLPDNLSAIDTMRVSPRVLAFAVLVSLASAFLFGLLPAFQGTRHDLTDAMRGDARSGATTTGRHAIRRALTAAEVALALMLLVGAGLLIRSFVHLQRIPLGFDPSGTLSVSLHLPDTRYPTEESRQAFFDRALEGARALPGVTAAARTTLLPPRGGIVFGYLQLEGQRDGSGGPLTYTGGTVSHEFFSLMRISVRAGRVFGAADTKASEPVVVINETMARKIFPHEDAVGKRIALSAPPKSRWNTIIGVVADVKAAGLRPAGHADYQVYTSDQQSPFQWGSLVLRTARDPRTLATPLRARITGIDPLLPVQDLLTGQARMAEELSAERFNLLLLGAFSALGLALASVGIYGVMALYVAQRRYEIGVRLALGATERSITRLVLGQSLAITLAGVAAGTIGALALTRVMRRLLFEVSPTDPLTFVVVIALVVAVGVISTLLPISRAVRVSPAAALRAE
jgi:putative ABC transport system permease protein